MALSAERQQQDAEVFSANASYKKFLDSSPLTFEERMDIVTLIYQTARQTGIEEGLTAVAKATGSDLDSILPMLEL